MPDYIPEAIRNDYKEASLILNDSPKASATLSRRCLQGMIRDFFGISKSNLSVAIEAIKDKIDPLTWDGIQAVRTIGNIGAHMEKDVDLIIDVDPSEADQLIALVETLLKEWYIARHHREVSMQALVQIAEEKTAQRQGGAPAADSSNPS